MPRILYSSSDNSLQNSPPLSVRISHSNECISNSRSTMKRAIVFTFLLRTGTAIAYLEKHRLRKRCTYSHWRVGIRHTNQWTTVPGLHQGSLGEVGLALGLFRGDRRHIFHSNRRINPHRFSICATTPVFTAHQHSLLCSALY